MRARQTQGLRPKPDVVKVHAVSRVLFEAGYEIVWLNGFARFIRAHRSGAIGEGAVELSLSPMRSMDSTGRKSGDEA